ncbi:hypothetical protein NC652_005473 [Populus alba x Populus x berolinensis]|nr:hypothetical protein NC652_005473 [Populus alba x Populus x berolinensis]
MFGISYGELFLLLGATAALIGPKDLPLIARTAGRLTGRAIGYVQMARGQFDSVMQQSQARQVHKELQDTMAQLDAIRHEIRSISVLNPGPLTRRLVDNLDPPPATNASGTPENADAENVPNPTISKVYTEQTAGESLPTANISKVSGAKVSDSCDLHSQATAYARLAESSALKTGPVHSGAGEGELTSDIGLLNVLPVSAESTGLLPNRQGAVNGSDIVLEAILEAEVAHSAKDFFAQPTNQIKYDERTLRQALAATSSITKQAKAKRKAETLKAEARILQINHSSYLLQMANNPTEPPTDDFLQEILGMPNFASAEAGLVGADAGLAGAASAQAPMMLQLSSGDGSGHISALGGAPGGGGAGFHGFPLGLSLEQGKGGFLKPEEASGSGNRFRDDIVDGRVRNVFHGQPMPTTVTAATHPPAMRPRVRARRGQATDPHSIAERLRRERIAERIRALQELVPSVNKTDRAAMLDEIVDYVKFLRLQVKVLSMSRLGGAGAVAPLVTDIPLSPVEDETGEGGRNQLAWEKWSNDGTERQVAKLMEENVGAAMQFLQSKALCIMPISLASAIYHTQPPDTTTIVKPETNPPS